MKKIASLMNTKTHSSDAPVGEEYEKLKVKWDNETVGDLKQYDCDKCLNKGYIAYYDGTHKVYECDCMIKRRSYAFLEQSGVMHLKDRYTFDNYTTEQSWQKHIKTKALEYLKEKCAWFYIGGQVGSGKSHICTALVLEEINLGRRARYMLWRDDVQGLKANINNDIYRHMISQFKRADILYIDDFLKTVNDEIPSDAEIKIAFEILNFRYNMKLKTVISSEKHLSTIESYDQALESRIYEMSKGYNLNIKIDNKRNVRKKNKHDMI